MAKKAVLIGCNYPGTKAELKGCVNDVRRVHRCLTQRFGFLDDDIRFLIDTDPKATQPTGANIRRAITDLVRSAVPGDFLFIHYSGHGTRLPAETGEDDDTGYDECIVPCDMNLITDDDFRVFVEELPQGCRLTIVSDSCHSGGLIENTKEQIGESTRREDDHGDAEPGSAFSLSSLIKKTKKTVKNAMESRGIDIPHRHNHSHQSAATTDDDPDELDQDQHQGRFQSRSLPLSALIEILKQRTGRQDIDVGNIRPTLFDLFGAEASPKVKKFMKVLLQSLGPRRRRSEGGGFFGLLGSLAAEFVMHKLEDKDDGYADPAMETQVGSKEEVYAGTKQGRFPHRGVLISGCQSDQTSADASPLGDGDGAYGALSNAIQVILAKSDGDVSNRKLVLKARKLLSRQGFTQRPGLYCSDEVVEEPFICS
ncbi:hypothetical protein HPP92_015413 [Vanilla planifolia]|uniref:Peptidase C14 caspase domain-containing protein n=1 Tax=Vanilla planifolia TaxID=51239 RepID=A0A835QVV4_VANPL|nr:hypothetical protein HPP92_015413 [Vanilla planifolia]